MLTTYGTGGRAVVEEGIFADRAQREGVAGDRTRLCGECDYVTIYSLKGRAEVCGSYECPLNKN